MSEARARVHPAPVAVVVGLAMGLVTVFVGLPWYTEAALWTLLLVAFAVWGSNWIRTPDFGAGVWLGLFLGGWTPLLQAVLFDTYLGNNPWYADDGLTRAAVFWWGLAMVAVYAVLLGGVQFLIQKVRSRGLEAVPPLPLHE